MKTDLECKNCKASFFDKPLHRTNPTGQIDAGWMCEDCLKIKEQNLHKELKKDGDLKVVNDVFNISKTWKKKN
jgi:hypothetical protein